jgi:thioredoxin reductase (NADPH)
MLDAIVIGGGPAGYTAALYLARAGRSPLCIEGYGAGGQLLTTTDVENFPGFPDGILGPELAGNIRLQAERFGARFLMRDVTSVDFSGAPLRVGTGADLHEARTVIIATGATAKQLGLESERRLANRGVAYCAVCDGPLFAGRRVAVVGGGDAAMQEALTLARFATEVLVVHRRREFRAAQVMVDAVAALPNAQILTPYVVEDVLEGEMQTVSGALVRNVETGEAHVEGLGGVFVSIGHHPNTELFSASVDVDGEGYIVVEPGSTKTSVEGVYAAGDVQDKQFRQAITAAASGCMAALEAEHWLTHRPAVYRSSAPVVSAPTAP